MPSVPSPSSASNQERLGAVDVLRAVAALGVAWFHLFNQNAGPELKSALPGALVTLSAWGRWGVPVFFVISGFVIAYTLHRRERFDRWSDWPLYLGRRMLRLDVLYLVVLAAYLVLIPLAERLGMREAATAWPFEDRGYDGGEWLKNFFYFLPLREPLYLPVAWTLAVEVQFYLLISAVFIAANRWGQKERLPAFFFLLALASLAYPTGLLGTPIGYWIGPSLFNLLAGVIAYYGLCVGGTRARAFNVLYLAAVGVIALVTRQTHVLAAFAGHALLWLSLRWMPLALRENRLLVALGLASYGIYITHQLVGAWITTPLVATKLFSGAWQLVPVCAGLAVTILLSWALYHAVEKHSIRWSKRIGR